MNGWLIGVALGAAASLAVGLQGLEAQALTAEERGGAHYQIFCSNCHGPNGRGDGPLVPLLRIVVTDLTRLARDSGGQFDAERVFNAIDGRHLVDGGTQKRMPVFSDNLEVRTIIELVAFLKTIQEY
jgi:hypothetical protein